MSFVLEAPCVVGAEAVLRPGFVVVSDGRVTDVGEGPSGAGGVVEVGGMVGAGFVDVHVHGGDGAEVNGDSDSAVAASLERIACFHARHGTTAFLATTVSDTPARLASTVAGVAGVVRRGFSAGARVLGVHLEGPWIARAKTGAQDPSALRRPDVGELRELIAAGDGCVRMVTVAPELPGAERLIAEAIGAGVRVAIGHTDADFDTARTAIDAGARHVTHLFNAMAPIHHRRPGAVTAALLDERVTIEVIADLEHVHPAVIALVARLAPGRMVAVSDAVPATGLEPGEYRLGGLDISVAGGRVTLASDPATLAGSTLTLDRAVSNLISDVGLPLEAAIAAGTSVPARAITGPADAGSADVPGLPLPVGPVGRLVPGAAADLVVLDGPAVAARSSGLSGSAVETAPGSGLGVVATLVGGRAVWDPTGMFAGVGGRDGGTGRP